MSLSDGFIIRSVPFRKSGRFVNALGKIAKWLQSERQWSGRQSAFVRHVSRLAIGWESTIAQNVESLDVDDALLVVGLLCSRPVLDSLTSAGIPVLDRHAREIYFLRGRNKYGEFWRSHPRWYFARPFHLSQRVACLFQKIHMHLMNGTIMFAPSTLFLFWNIHDVVVED